MVRRNDEERTAQNVSVKVFQVLSNFRVDFSGLGEILGDFRAVFVNLLFREGYKLYVRIGKLVGEVLSAGKEILDSRCGRSNSGFVELVEDLVQGDFDFSDARGEHFELD